MVYIIAVTERWKGETWSRNLMTITNSLKNTDKT